MLLCKGALWLGAGRVWLGGGKDGAGIVGSGTGGAV